MIELKIKVAKTELRVFGAQKMCEEFEGVCESLRPEREPDVKDPQQRIMQISPPLYFFTKRKKVVRDRGGKNWFMQELLFFSTILDRLTAFELMTA